MADRTNPQNLDPLDQLALQAELDAGPSGSTGEPGADFDQDTQPPPVTNAQAFAGAVAAGREMFCFFTKLESPRRVLNDGRITELAALVDPVLAKHGIQLGQYLGDYGAELALAVATFSLVTELRAAVNAELAAKAPKEESAPAQMVDEVLNDGNPETQG